MTTLGGPGETGNVYLAAHQLFAERLAEVAALFIQYPLVQATSVEIHNGRIEIVADGVAGVLMNWARAIPNHVVLSDLAVASYGSRKADVIEGEHIRVTVRRPHAAPGQVNA